MPPPSSRRTAATPALPQSPTHLCPVMAPKPRLMRRRPMEKSTLELKVLAVQGWGTEGLLLSQPAARQVTGVLRRLCHVPSPDYDYRKVRPGLEPLKKRNQIIGLNFIT